MKKALTPLVLLGVLLAQFLGAPAADAATPTVRVTVARTTVIVGSTVAFNVTARSAATGQRATLEQLRGKKWTRIAAKALPATRNTKRVRFATRSRTTGVQRFRVTLAAKGRYRSARSATIAIRVIPRAASPRPAARPLRFDLSGARGLALSSPPASARVSARIAGSNVDVVTGTGEVRDAVVSGNAEVQDVVIAPNGTVYAIFNGRVDLADTSRISSRGCLLAEVDTSTGVPACIDQTLSYIGSEPQSNPPVQVDPAGSVYYRGYLADGRQVLRRYSRGAVTDLVSDNVFISDFVTLAQGGVVVTGFTSSSGQAWTRRITPGGGLQTLSSQSWDIALFPDDNVYLLSTSSSYDILRFLTSTMQMDSRNWLDGAPSSDAYHHCSDGICLGTTKGKAVTSDDRVFVRSKGDTSTQVLQAYPTVSWVDQLSVKDAGVLSAVGSQLLVAGRDHAGANILVRYDPATATESTLIGSDSETEIYHLGAVDETTVLFDGLRFADNRVVVGSIDISTGEVTILDKLAKRWDDLQTFGAR